MNHANTICLITCKRDLHSTLSKTHSGTYQQFLNPEYFCKKDDLLKRLWRHLLIDIESCDKRNHFGKKLIYQMHVI